jgi:hypothetical protein
MQAGGAASILKTGKPSSSTRVFPEQTAYELLLASAISEKQDTAAYLRVLAKALRNYGAPEAIVTDARCMLRVRISYRISQKK